MKRISKCLFLMAMSLLVLGFPRPALADESTPDTTATVLTAAAESSNVISLNWTAVPDVSGYRVEKSGNPDSGFTLLSTVSSVTTSYKDTKVTTGKYYYYRVTPVAADKTIMTSSAMTAKSVAPARAELRKIRVESESQIRIYWKVSAGATGYEIYRSNSKSGTYTLLGKVEQQSFTTYLDQTVVPGRNFYYKVRAYATVDGVTGYAKSSSYLRGRSIGAAVVTSISSKNSTTMNLRWSSVAGASSYEIYRSTRQTSGYRKMGTVSASKTSFSDTKAKAGRNYFYRIIAVAVVDGTTIKSVPSVQTSSYTLAQVKIRNVILTDTNYLQVRWYAVDGAEKYKIYRANSANGSYKMIGLVDAPQLSYDDTTVKTQRTYYYKVRAYDAADGVHASGNGTPSSAKKGMTMYTIMGNSQVTAAQMAALYNASGRSYPSAVYASKGAPTIYDFAQIVLEEAKAEGVRGEVIFAQSCLETGYLSFGGQVSAEQCNFSGLGATDDGAAGATFPDVRTGIRAQVQHMKGYASTAALNNTCVDPRYYLLGARRGSCPYVEKLGNGNWATDPFYASKLLRLIRTMKSY